MASPNAKGLSPQQIKSLEEILARGGTIKYAAHLLGCHEVSLNRMRRRGIALIEEADALGKPIPKTNRYVRIADAYDRGLARLVASEVDNIRAHAPEDWTASKYILEKFAPEQFAPPQKIDIKTTQTPVEREGIDYSVYTDDELVTLEALIKKGLRKDK